MPSRLVPQLVTSLTDYRGRDFLSDLTAGLIVGIVALPLAIAFGIASGVSPAQGLYTAIVAGKNATTGIALVEAYDLGTASLDVSGNATLANISTRGFVNTNDNVMIGGFIIRGEARRVVARAIGPSLTGSGVPGAIQDTVLELRDGFGTLLFSNDDWRSTQEQEIIATGLAPSDDRESAIVANLAPANYTGIVSGKNNTTGVGLVEVYVLP